MIQYALPGFTTHLRFNMMFIDLLKSAPELFYNDIKIECLYGCFPNCIMNGGRVIQGERYSIDQINRTFDTIEKAGISIRLTFTNMLIQPKDFDDEYGNNILKAAQGRNAKVIVNSDELGEYISNRYHLNLILSTTRALNGIEELNAMLDRYDMVVLNYNHNKDYEFLKQVRNPHRLEMMVNELCKPGCEYRQKHYESDSLQMLNLAAPVFCCQGGGEGPGFTTRIDNSPTILSNDEIRKLNNSFGISHFKIVGRAQSKQLNTESFLYYLIRPEYHSVVYKIIKNK